MVKNDTNNVKKLTAIDLFSGPGGFSNGLEKAGFEVLTGIDFDKDAVETYNLNHKNPAMLADLTDLDPKEIQKFIGTKKLDVIVGSPPCQGFSVAGRRYAEDPRNKLYKEFVRVVSFFKPKIVVLENVYGLIEMRKKDGRKVVEDIIKDFEELGYNIEVKVLNAADYGVPQRRRRAIFIANNLKLENIFPESTHQDIGFLQKTLVNRRSHVTVDDSISDLLDKEIPKLNHVAAKTSKEDLARIKLLKEGQWAADLPSELQPKKCKPHNGGGEWFYGRCRRMHGKETARTITAVAPLYHPRFNRKLTVRENARLQSFDDNFIFTGNIGSMYRQVGNAVPPLLARRIGESIAQMLMGNKARKRVRLPNTWKKKLEVLELTVK